MRFLMFSIFVMNFFIQYAVSTDCYWNSGCKYKYFSSKTPYENIRGDIRDSYVELPGCEPISIWAVMRHGKKNPGVKFLKHMKEVMAYKDHIISSYDNGNSQLCAQDIDNFREWEVHRSFIEEPNMIMPEGYQEMVGIGKRFRASFSKLLNNLTEEDYLFTPTFGPRTGVSIEAFIEGFGSKDFVLQIPKSNQSTASPYGACDIYLKEVFDNPDTYNETLVYMKTEEYLGMRERLEKKLNINVTLTNKNIVAMYDLCRYTSDGINKKNSPWCAIFSEEDLKILEYIADLEHYYRNGYGASQYSKIFGETLLADLLIKLQEAKDGKGKKIVVYNSHSTMMDMVVVALNLFKDTNPLTGTHRDVNRKYRSTFVSTFGVNMLAVLNRCRKSGENVYDHKIAFYWNERPLLEMCDEGVCTWQHLKDMFSPFLNVTIDFCGIDKTE